MAAGPRCSSSGALEAETTADLEPRLLLRGTFAESAQLHDRERWSGRRRSRSDGDGGFCRVLEELCEPVESFHSIN